MTRALREGMSLFHRNPITGKVIGANIHKILDDKVTIKSEVPIIDDRTEFEFPISHFGKWLFFEEDDAAATLETVCLRDDYRRYGNKELNEAYAKHCKVTEIDQQKKALLDHLKTKYSFEGYVHYTDFWNFKNIMAEGYLYSRVRALQENSRLVTDAAHHSVLRITPDEYKKYVRFFYRPKTPTLHKNEGIKKGNGSPHMPIPVLLLFDESIVYADNVLFLDGGGGSGATRKEQCAERALTFNWDQIFGDYTDSATNHRNAEFLVYEKVGTDRIKKIIFRSEPERQMAILLLGDSPLYAVDSSKFSTSGDGYNYLTLFELTRDKRGTYSGSLGFHSNPDGYEHKLLFMFEDGCSEVMELDVRGQEQLRKLVIPPLKSRPLRICYILNDHMCAIWEEKS